MCPIFPSIRWCMVQHLHLIQTWLYKTPDPTLQHTVSPSLPISHANKELFLNTLHKKNCNSRVLKLSRLRRKTISAARECRVGEAATSADTRHGNYPINLTFSASDVIQTQNMDCWQCWQCSGDTPHSSTVLFNCLLVTCRLYRYLVTQPDKVLHLNCEKFNISLHKATNKAFKYLACILYFYFYSVSRLSHWSR